MKVFGLIIIVGFLGIAPVAVFEAVVMPQITDMHATYASFDQIAEDVAAGKDINTAALQQK